LVAAVIAVLLFAYRDLVFSRLFALDTPTEAQSISDRQRDAALAVTVIRGAPLTGVGLGEYLVAAQRLDADAARVHNVPLLVTAELGLPGLLLWLWLMAAPFWLWLRRGAAARSYAEIGPRLAPWVAMLVINTFDTTLWLSGNWQTSFLFALVAANAVSSIQYSVERRIILNTGY
jgi:O-antigen ligase